MTRISERQSLTREDKFIALVHFYAELRLPFAAAWMPTASASLAGVVVTDSFRGVLDYSSVPFPGNRQVDPNGIEPKTA